ncbi:MAG: hypothetical protein KF726_23965 [Anaerolineae bacterium]|nr:hypothetical protein [Anaerolineae bacterium]
MPLGVGVPTELIRGDVYFWQSLMGAAILVAIPVALIYTFFLDRFIAGFTLGAVKVGRWESSSLSALSPSRGK